MRVTPLKNNMDLKHIPLENKNHLPNLYFAIQIVYFPEYTKKKSKNLSKQNVPNPLFVV